MENSLFVQKRGVSFAQQIPQQSRKMEYLKEKDIVFRVFNEMQEYPKKSEQFSEILANVYVHFPDSFAKDYSVCVYSVLGHKGSGKEIDLLLRFIAAVSTRCSGDGTVPHFAPILVEV